jgi:hypothetical protein
MKLLTALLLTIAGTVGVSGGAMASVVKTSDQPKEPPSTTSVVQVQSSANLTTETSGQSAGSAPVINYDIAPPLAIVPLALNPKPIPPDTFWDRLAWCETHGNWQNGGNWAGGLGIARSTWKRWGGHEFARTPDKATREEQIIVANRVAIFGWQSKDSYLTLDDRVNNRPHFRKPVGFNGWGALPCAGGRPALMVHTQDTVIAQRFKWGQTGRVVKDLQALLRIKATGKYDARTWAAHQNYIIKNGLDRRLAPAPKLVRPANVRAHLKNDTKRCPQYEQDLFNAGFPENQIRIASYVMWRESRCDAKVKNSKDPRGGSHGLMQINGFWVRKLVKAGVINSVNDLYNPQKNMRAAYEVWTMSMLSTRKATGWTPWALK